MATRSTLVVLSAVVALGGCAASVRAQPPGCPAVQNANANERAPTAANRLNGAIVGAERQRRNEQQAEAPRYPCGTASLGASPGASRGEGVASRQAPGRASMQPGSDATANQVGQTAAQATSGFESTVRDVAEATNPPGPYRPFAIEINPLGLLLGGRLSLNGEWAPITHHAIQVSPHFVHTTANVALSGGAMGSEAFTGVGTELGYRYYTGTRGMNGVFVGPSLIVGVYNAALPMGSRVFTDVGIAGDVGLQEILWDHVVVGAGVGIEYLQVSHDFGDLPTGPSTIAATGVKPRFLLEAGYGF